MGREAENLRAGARSGRQEGSFRLDDPALLLEAQPGIARKELRRLAVAQVDEEVRLPPAVGKKCRVHHRIVEAGHRAAVEADRARRDDEIGALQRAVAEGGDFGERLLVLARSEEHTSELQSPYDLVCRVLLEKKKL